MSKTQLGFVFTPEFCIQCHACETACKSWRGLEQGIRWRRVTSHFEGKYPKPKLITASVSCLHCGDAACVQACPVGAITKREEDGAVLVDPERCVGCRICLKVCPVGAPQFGADGIMQKCDLCVDYAKPKEEDPPCVKVCPSRCLSRVFLPVEQKDALDREAIRLLHGERAEV